MRSKLISVISDFAYSPEIDQSAYLYFQFFVASIGHTDPDSEVNYQIYRTILNQKDHFIEFNMKVNQAMSQNLITDSEEAS